MPQEPRGRRVTPPAGATRDRARVHSFLGILIQQYQPEPAAWQDLAWCSLGAFCLDPVPADPTEIRDSWSWARQNRRASQPLRTVQGPPLTGGVEGVPAGPQRDDVAWGQRRSLAAPGWTRDGDGVPGRHDPCWTRDGDGVPGHHDLCWTRDGDGVPGRHDLTLGAAAGVGRREAQMPQDAPTQDLRDSRLGSLGIPGRGRRQCPSPGYTRGGRTQARVRVSEGGEVPSQDPQGADRNDGVRRPCSCPPWSGGLEGQDHSEALGQNSGTSRGRYHSECSLTAMRSKEQGKQKWSSRWCPTFTSDPLLQEHR
ncbi:uncharacterized protein LOC123793980 [Ursus americanus]|uniref:uncharacterized protein LOC123793980 n=1 Tax=Ursus americanus TaxID=9643 RepID=UPI001E67B3EF|nr:uncharacterized protein LOC123793980 [Ursus americanus]